MVDSIHFLTEINGPGLDDYLSRGWFRMGQTIFTTEFIPVGSTIHRVFWLRLLVEQVRYGKKQQKLLETNKNIDIAVKPFYPTDELEDLYTSYRNAVNFDAPPSVGGFLLEPASGDFKNVFDTYMIELRKNEQLIAAGIFDKGENSIAGIMNFYHPAYKSKSLGKYLMLLKINLAMEWGKKYYYPGYIVGGYPKFDYKLFPDAGATEWYDSIREEWIPYTGSSLPQPFIFNLDDYNSRK